VGFSHDKNKTAEQRSPYDETFHGRLFQKNAADVFVGGRGEEYASRREAERSCCVVGRFVPAMRETAHADGCRSNALDAAAWG